MPNFLAIEPLTSQQVVFLAILFVVSVISMVGCVTKIVCDVVGRIRVSQPEIELKKRMIDAGYSTDDMIRLWAHWSRTGPARGNPLASEVVVERDGEWTTALLLDADQGRYYVHFVGEEMSSNQWIPGNRVRFPESDAQNSMMQSHSEPDAYSVGNSTYAKPARIETEL